MTAACFRSRLYGLDIESDMDLYARRLPLTRACEVRVETGEPITTPRGAPDGDVQVAWATPEGLRATFVRRPSGDHLLRFEATCDIVMDRVGTQITVHMVDGVPEAMGGVLVAGTVLSYLLMVRGEPVLHASAVEVAGRAIGFVGSSGMGKTTLATLLCQSGGRLITDDVLRLGHRDGGVFGCYLGATELRLRTAAAELAHGFGENGADRLTADDRRALSVPASDVEGLPLAALVIPRPRRDSTAFSLTRLDAHAGALQLLSFPRILGIQDRQLLADQFAHTMDIAAGVPVFVADVPWGPPFDPAIAEHLIAALGRSMGVSFDRAG